MVSSTMPMPGPGVKVPVETAEVAPEIWVACWPVSDAPSPSMRPTSGSSSRNCCLTDALSAAPPLTIISIDPSS